ncbi:adenylate cyclase, partial [Lunasporangiospora selenospora]
MTTNEANEHPAVTRFREYLRIKTVQPNPDYAGSTAFLIREAEELGLPYKIVECVKGKPAVIMTVEGSDPSLPSLLLNSHTDVVPVFIEKWTQDPFAANKVDGFIYARGSQDMKCVGISYLEVIRRFKAAGKKPLRTIHLSWEEVGGTEGMKLLVHHEEFKNLNVAFALDEGIASPKNALKVFY